MPPIRANKPPYTPLSRQRVTEAALSLADASGTEKLTMRALATALGVEAMSLYNHVRNKEDLMDALVESVVAEIELPRAGRVWREEMRRRALSMRVAFLTHSWAPPLIVGRINTGPNMLLLLDTTLGCLHTAGFSYSQADQIMNALDSYIYGFHLLERSFPLKPEEFADVAQAFLQTMDMDRYPHFSALAQLVAQGRYDGVNHMAFGLDRLLQALDEMRT